MCINKKRIMLCERFAEYHYNKIINENSLSLFWQFVFCQPPLLENITIFRSRGVNVLNVIYFALRHIMFMIMIIIMQDPEIYLASLHGYSIRVLPSATRR